jgi:sucrose-phosphate synthase
MTMNSIPEQLHIVLLSIHGLIRGHDLELGRDADTGGQTKYVVELARALGEHPRVGRVDLLTRRVTDPQVSDDYDVQVESLGEGVQIVRITCGEEVYLPKEELWDTLDIFVDQTLEYLREQNAFPHLIHSHYADAGYVGTHLAGQLGVPLVHTGHSLGRVKRRRLLAGGLGGAELEERYKISRRIAAEESTLGYADLVITSTQQEVDAQYGLYDYYQPEQMRVIPPGIDLERFFPPRGDEPDAAIHREIRRFLSEPEKPMILALSRPDRRKNITSLVAAYGCSPDLQELANLVIVAGNRDDIGGMDDGSRKVLNDILLAVDRHDLYGKVAYPKHHQADDVSILYRLAALSRGVFVNPALTEPFGLTLLEAAASGLPIVATDDGGPVDIIANCRNGKLIDPLDIKDIRRAITRMLTNQAQWDEMAANGTEGVRRHYSWQGHTEAYVEAVTPLVSRVPTAARPVPREWSGRFRDRAIIADLDKSLLGDSASLRRFIEVIRGNRKQAAFGIATGRRLNSALRVLRRHDIPRPDVLITSIGTDIYYAPNLTRDTRWREHIDQAWNPRTIRRLLAELPGLEYQPMCEQGQFKISYYYDPAIAPSPEEITSLLLKGEQTVNMFVSFGQFLDVVPVRASKGAALRWFAAQRDIPLQSILAAGGSGADEDMMRGNTMAVVVANRHDEELSDLSEIDRILFAKTPHAAGILEAIEHYDFFGDCRVPVS